ncbi:MAG: galactokinase [bacterium]
MTTAWRAPGRVNVIGEHTDYNGGFALPMAIAEGCTATVERLDDPVLRVRSAQRDDVADVSLDKLAPETVPDWAGYAAGVVAELRRRGVDTGGLDIHVDGNVPLGAGLSSSAALSCSVVSALDDLLELKLEREEWVKIARAAENDFVGAPTGGMDQMASVLGQAGHVLLCDMATATATPVPFDLVGAELTLVIADSHAPHAHADGEYRARREACERGAALLGVDTLRAVQDEDHSAVLDRLRSGGAGDEVVRRVRHILTENARVLAVVERLRAHDVAGTGPLLTESHRSMRDDFEITVERVDVAVEAALEAGALGARMTGGGFGGCVIALTPQEQADAVGAEITRRFADAEFQAPRLFTGTPSAGAHLV